MVREGGSDGEASVGRWNHPTDGPKVTATYL